MSNTLRGRLLDAISTDHDADLDKRRCEGCEGVRPLKSLEISPYTGVRASHLENPESSIKSTALHPHTPHTGFSQAKENASENASLEGFATFQGSVGGEAVQVAGRQGTPSPPPSPGSEIADTTDSGCRHDTGSMPATVTRATGAQPAQAARTPQDIGARAARVPDTTATTEPPPLPPPVQAVLARFPGASITAVRRYGQDRAFPLAPGWWTGKPMSYAEGSAAATASLPPPQQMTAAWAVAMHLQDFGRPPTTRPRNKGPP